MHEPSALPPPNPVTFGLRLLHYHRALIAKVAFGVVLFSLLFSIVGRLAFPVYQAESTVTILPSQLEIGFTSGRSDFRGLHPAIVLSQTHTEFLLSRELAEDVVRTMMARGPADGAAAEGDLAALLRDRIFVPARSLAYNVFYFLNYGMVAETDEVTRLSSILRSRTNIRNVPASYILRISVRLSDPDLAADVVNMMADRYVEMTLRANQEEMRITRAFIDERIKEHEHDLEAIENDIKTHKESQQIYTESRDITLKLEELSAYFRDANETRARIAELDTRIRELTEYSTPTDLALAQAEHEGLKTRLTSIETVIDRQLQRLDSFPAKEERLLELYRKRSQLEKGLSLLQDRLLDTRIAEAAQLSAIRVIDRAVPPLYPTSPKILKNVAIGAVIGLVLAGALVAWIELRRQHVRTPEEFSAFPHPLVGVVPLHRHPRRDVLFEEPDPETEEGPRPVRRGHEAVVRAHIDHVWTKLMGDGRGSVVLLTSPHQGDGKTFLTERLADAAFRAGNKVLLVDADVLHPQLHEVFEQASSPGVLRALHAETIPPGAIVAVNRYVELLTAGDPAEHRTPWDAQRARRTLREAAARYDLVLIDGTPLRLDPKLAQWWPVMDRMVCVFDAATCTQEIVKDASRRIAGCDKPVGYILNKVGYEADFHYGG